MPTSAARDCSTSLPSLMSERIRIAGLLTPNQTVLIKELFVLRRQMGADRYWRPRDLGASRNSHHTVTLNRLADRGLVERAPCGVSTELRTFGYRLTDKGALLWEELQELLHVPLNAVLGSSHVRARAQRTQELLAA